MTAKHAIVTGSSRGVGKAISTALIANGWSIWGVRRQPESEKSSSRADLRVQHHTLQADLFDRRGIEKTIHWIERPLSGIVCNAGIKIPEPILGNRTHHIVHENNSKSALLPAFKNSIDYQIEANLIAPLQLIRALLNANKVGSPCSIVFISSNLARRGLSGYVAYSAAKAGLEAATRTLARELGPKNIRVNAVAPGLLRTDMTKSMGDAGYKTYASEVPLGRVGEAEDVAPLVSFLLGESSGYITGQVIDVDGGWAV